MGFKHVKAEFEQLSKDDFGKDAPEAMATFLYWMLRLQFEAFGTLDSIDQRLRELNPNPPKKKRAAVDDDFISTTPEAPKNALDGQPQPWSEGGGW